MNKENCLHLGGVSKSKRRRIQRRRQERKTSSCTTCQQHGELLAKLDELSAHVQYNTDKVHEVHQRIDACEKQVSRHEEKIYALYSLERQGRHIINMVDEAFGFIGSGCCLVQGAIRQQQHEHERETHRFLNTENLDETEQQ